MSTLRCVALSALRNAAIGAVSGAVFGGIDAGLGGRNVIEGVISGSISGAAFGALATFSELRLLLGVIGIKSGTEGVIEAAQDGDYDLAAWRATTTIIAILSLKSEIFNKRVCFTEDTLIYTKDGYKKIKDIEVGDEVYSRNPETGKKGLKRVVNVFIRDIKKLIHLKVGDQEIETTATHPFWVEDIGWVNAIELKPGDKLVMYSGEILEVKEAFVEYLDKPIKVYNFEVEDWHTYFVPEYNVFVHNDKCGGAGAGKARDFKFPKSNNDMKKVFGVKDKVFHKEIKPEIIKQIKKDSVYSKEFRKMGNNPDIGVDDIGKIVLKDVKTGKTLLTNWSFESFIP